MRIRMQAFYALAWSFAYSLPGHATYDTLSGIPVSVDHSSGAFN